MKKFAPVFVLSAGTLWGIMGIFVRKLGTYGFSSLQIACLRILFGAVLFLLITGVFDRNLLKIQPRDSWLFLGMGLVSLLMFTVCYFTTISMASLSVAAILLYTSPIWVMLMSAVFFREKITGRKLLCAAMAFGGCVLVSGVGSASSISPMVLVTGLLSAVGYGLYSIFGTFALRKYQPLTVTTYAFIKTGLRFIPPWSQPIAIFIFFSPLSLKIYLSNPKTPTPSALSRILPKITLHASSITCEVFIYSPKSCPYGSGTSPSPVSSSIV